MLIISLQGVTVITSKIADRRLLITFHTDHHNKYNNSEQSWKYCKKLPKCNTGTGSEQMLLEKKNGAKRLAQFRVTINLQYVTSVTVHKCTSYEAQ